MSRIQALFAKKNKEVLNVYCTAGYPALNSTIPIMQALQESGADLIELGMPYSDPLADGPVIQASSTQSLANGMTINVLFDQLKNFLNADHQQQAIDVPVILMGYMNYNMVSKNFVQKLQQWELMDLFYLIYRPMNLNMNMVRSSKNMD
jgi:tryptophan synthase alpha chain